MRSAFVCIGRVCDQSPVTNHQFLIPMFLRLVSDSFTRRPRRKLLTGAALALGMAVATAALSVSLDIGDKLAREFRGLGANLVVTPQADTLPLEIGGVDYRPANAGAYLPESDLPRIKTVFWRNNILAFAPVLETSARAWSPASRNGSSPGVSSSETPVIGTWVRHEVALADGGKFVTGIAKTNPWWQIEGRWFSEGANECVVGANFARRNRVKPGDLVLLHGREKGKQSVAQRVTGILSTGGPEDDAIMVPLSLAQALAGKAGEYHKLYVSALTKPEDDFARRDPKTMNAD